MTACAFESPLKSPSDAFGIYIHIPYCLQKCDYCDFVKYLKNEIPPIEDYFKLLRQELGIKKIDPSKVLSSVYFGGGTPSLAPVSELKSFLKEIFSIYPNQIENLETTIEINPGTLSYSDLKELNAAGFNRFSLGAQTFNAGLLRKCGRDHSPQDTIQDLEAFRDLKIRYTLDLLYGLPDQTVKDLKEDLEIVKRFDPPHVSIYNLTLPESHSMNIGRPEDETQVEMLELIRNELIDVGLQRYEVSNFSKPGFESLHNLGYWSDQSYWGIGLGAHSYFKSDHWGRREWHSGVYSNYEKHLENPEKYPKKTENLKLHESVTDYCHTSMRTIFGLKVKAFKAKYGFELFSALEIRLKTLEESGLITYTDGAWILTSKGFEIPNEIYRELCFLKEDLQ